MILLRQLSLNSYVVYWKYINSIILLQVVLNGELFSRLYSHFVLLLSYSVTRGRCFDLSFRHFMCVRVSHDFVHTVLPVVMEFGTIVLGTIQFKKQCMCKDIFISVPFQNSGPFVGLFRSYGNTPWPILNTFGFFRYLYKTI